jgi:flagellar hook-length control protein FliK
VPSLAANAVIASTSLKSATAAAAQHAPEGFDAVFAALFSKDIANVGASSAPTPVLSAAQAKLTLSENTIQVVATQPLPTNVFAAANRPAPTQMKASQKTSSQKEPNPALAITPSMAIALPAQAKIEIAAPQAVVTAPAQPPQPGNSSPPPRNSNRSVVTVDAKATKPADVISALQAKLDVPVIKSNDPTLQANQAKGDISAAKLNGTAFQSKPNDSAAKLSETAHTASEKAVQSLTSLADIQKKAGANNDQSQATKVQIGDKIAASLSSLDNQDAKPALKPTAADRLPEQVQAGEKSQNPVRNNNDANNNPSNHEQSQKQPFANTDTAATARATNQTQHAATPTTVQSAFQNTVDTAQAALPAGGAQASTVTAALQVAPRAHSDASLPQPNIGALAVTIAAKSEAGSKRFDIRLDPPELGRIDVRLSVDDAGKAQAQLSADNQQTLDLLQRDKSTLERALKDAGLDLRDNGLNFSLKGQDRQQDNPSNANTGRALDVSTVTATDPANPLQQHILSADSTRLDIKV